MEETKFITGQEVLVRNSMIDNWKFDIYSNYLEKNYKGTSVYITIGGEYIYCIPYKGNEHLVGKINDPKEDLPIGTPVMACNILTDWRFGYYAGNGCISTRKANIYLLNMKYIIPVDKFDFNNPENSLKYNIVNENRD